MLRKTSGERRGKGNLHHGFLLGCEKVSRFISYVFKPRSHNGLGQLSRLRCFLLKLLEKVSQPRGQRSLNVEHGVIPTGHKIS
jgi:hypothetical protein